MTRSILVLLAAACLLACGPGPKDADQPKPPSSAGVDATPNTKPDDSPLTESECGDMLDHVVDIGHAEQKRTLDPDHVPTDVQVADIKRAQRERATPMCLKLPRTAYRCALAAMTPGDLARCDEKASPEPAQ